MSNTKYTPGAWVIHPYISDGKTSIFNQTGTAQIAEVISGVNANLIASAPDLLKALIEAKEVLLQLDHRHNGKCYNPASIETCTCTLCKIDNAINKATV
jgi:hypothetical protein